MHSILGGGSKLLLPETYDEHVSSTRGDQNLTSDQDLTRSGMCNEHVFAEIADRNAISATRHTKMARATPNNTKAVRKEAKPKYELKPELKLHHPTVQYPHIRALNFSLLFASRNTTHKKVKC